MGARQALCACLVLAAVASATAGRAWGPQSSPAETAAATDVAAVPLKQPRRTDRSQQLLLLHSLASAITSGLGYYDPAAEAAPPAAAAAGRLRGNSNSSSSSRRPALRRTASAQQQQQPQPHDGSNYEPTPPHKPLWPHWDERDAVLFALTAVTLFIAGGCVVAAQCLLVLEAPLPCCC
jgi:hypothetical protein